jgi:hypothetical protein
MVLFLIFLPSLFLHMVDYQCRTSQVFSIGYILIRAFLSVQKYEELKVDLIRTERHLLKEMGFICHVEHPHKFIINYLLQLQAPPEMMQEAWNLANDR